MIIVWNNERLCVTIGKLCDVLSWFTELYCSENFFLTPAVYIVRVRTIVKVFGIEFPHQCIRYFRMRNRAWLGVLHSFWW